MIKQDAAKVISAMNSGIRLEADGIAGLAKSPSSGVVAARRILAYRKKRNGSRIRRLRSALELAEYMLCESPEETPAVRSCYNALSRRRERAICRQELQCLWRGVPHPLLLTAEELQARSPQQR